MLLRCAGLCNGCLLSSFCLLSGSIFPPLLLQAANYLNIKSLLDLTCLTVSLLLFAAMLFAACVCVHVAAGPDPPHSERRWGRGMHG